MKQCHQIIIGELFQTGMQFPFCLRLARPQNILSQTAIILPISYMIGMGRPKAKAKPNPYQFGSFCKISNFSLMKTGVQIENKQRKRTRNAKILSQEAKGFCLLVSCSVISVKSNMICSHQPFLYISSRHD